jgi:hypothetical protein
MKKRGVRKCKHCKQLFLPNFRQCEKQKYCLAPACRRVRNVDYLRLWRARPENLDHFKGAGNVKRTRNWREAHPGYGRRKGIALQNDCRSQPVANETVAIPEVPLQNDCFRDNPLIIGMISHFSGALQNDIEAIIVRLHAKGQMILGKGPGIATKKETEHAGKASVER